MERVPHDMIQIYPTETAEHINDNNILMCGRDVKQSQVLEKGRTKPRSEI